MQKNNFTNTQIINFYIKSINSIYTIGTVIYLIVVLEKSWV